MALGEQGPTSKLLAFGTKTNELNRMSFVTVEVDIEGGRILPREPEKVPQSAKGLA
jgi:hypothetical protein